MRGLRGAAALAAILSAAGTGAAEPDAARDRAVRAPGDPDACRAGLAHERAGALPRAFVELSRCTAREPAAAEAAAALARTRKKLAAGDYAPVSFSLQPKSAEVRIAPFTDAGPLVEPYELWLPFGTHVYAASAPGHAAMRGEIVVDSTARIHLQVELDPVVRARPSRSVDFADDGPSVGEPIVVADPRPKKMPSLIPERFRRGLDGDHAAGARGEPSPARVRGRQAPPSAARRKHTWPWILTWGL